MSLAGSVPSARPGLAPAVLTALALIRRGSRVGLTSLFSLTVVVGCGIGDFDIDRDIDEQRVTGNALSGLLDSMFNAPIPMNINMQEEISARDSGRAQAAHLTRLEFGITKSAMVAPDTDDFSFLQSATVYIESAKAGSGLARQKIAEVLDVKASDRLRFHTFDSVDVLPYSEEGARFVSEVSGHAPPDDVTFDGSYTVTVELF